MSQINMALVYERVSNWNAARYDRVYNQDLALGLLREELQEYLDATSDVDRLDALCDITYVAMGCVWKLNADEAIDDFVANAVGYLNAVLPEALLEPAHILTAYLTALEHDVDWPPHMICHICVLLANRQMARMGLQPEHIEAALLAVCNANDTKTIAKTDSSVKANVDKGSFFKSPEPALQAILDSLEVTNVTH